MSRCVACRTEAVEGTFCRMCGAPLPAPWPRPAALPGEAVPGDAVPAVPVAVLSASAGRRLAAVLAGAVVVLALAAAVWDLAAPLG